MFAAFSSASTLLLIPSGCVGVPKFGREKWKILCWLPNPLNKPKYKSMYKNMAKNEEAKKISYSFTCTRGKGHGLDLSSPMLYKHSIFPSFQRLAIFFKLKTLPECFLLSLP